MPKSKTATQTPKPRCIPYSIDVIKNSLREWKDRADSYEKDATDKYKSIKAYINAHREKINLLEAEQIYTALSSY